MKKLFITPWFWIIVYICLIISFAGIYTLNNSHFYNSNITREKDYAELINSVELNFQQELSDLILANNDKELYYLEIPDTQYALSVDDIEVTLYHPKDVSFNVMVNLLNNQPTASADKDFLFMMHSVIYNFKLTGTRFLMEDDTVLQNCLITTASSIYNPITSQETINNIDISEVLGGYNWNLRIKIPNELDDNILTLLKSEDGYVDGFENNFFRMLYLSVVTITTLGFGDITPITDFARLLIGLESILGVVILSLFINAIFQKISNAAIKNENL